MILIHTNSIHETEIASIENSERVAEDEDLDCLLDFPKNDITKKEIIEALGMSSKSKIYIVDRGSPIVKDIVNMEKKMSLQITENEETKLKRPIPAK